MNINDVYVNLIPDIINPSPDYYCTWQTQLYATSDGKVFEQRKIISEKALFNKSKPYAWAYFYEDARKDLILVMDDSWDVPLDGNPGYYGSLVLNCDKFPSFSDEDTSPEDALKKLGNEIKNFGWKSFGGWVCAQESELYTEASVEEYWIKRLKWAEYSGMSYWKIDWGSKDKDCNFRKSLSRLAHKYAPGLTLENAIVKEVIPYSDVYRTYDVPAVMSIPMTMEKLKECIDVANVHNEFTSLINCEDEVYIAAALGCTMGVMRNPYTGNLPDGKPDPSFPDCHRRIKSKMTEVTRAARWHRIAPAFGGCPQTTYYSDTILHDTWHFEDIESEIEEWWLNKEQIKNFMNDNILTKSACAAISRNIPLPEIKPDENGDVPYVLASKNPNGVISVATCGRTRERKYWIPECSVSIYGGNSAVFGIFGVYKELCINLDYDIADTQIYAQDIAGDCSYCITSDVEIYKNKLVVPGDIIDTIGTMCQDKNDTSEPGMILKILVREDI